MLKFYLFYFIYLPLIKYEENYRLLDNFIVFAINDFLI